MDPGDASNRLNELLALPAGGIAPLREAVAKLDREDAGELLLTAVLRLASLEAAGLAADMARERDPDESRAGNVVELPVADPFTDHSHRFSAMLDQARQLRVALTDLPDVQSVLNAVGALSSEERDLLVLELALDALLGEGNGR